MTVGSTIATDYSVRATIGGMGRISALRAALRTVILAGLAASTISADRPDFLATARRLYNEGQYDQALETAKAAAAAPALSSSARLIMGRARLERFRQALVPRELDEARADLRAVDPRALDPRERIELQVGLGELLYLEDRFGPAAELLEPVVEASATLAPDAHARALDWWATALDRQAQTLPAPDRAAVYPRIIARMEQELRRDPSSAPATYWLAASARAAGDLDRAWAAAHAGWIRAALGRDRGVALRADLDKLVTLAIIPDRAAKAPSRDRRQAAASLTAEWEAFKKIW
jgi:tetratricopeptide (TPR) repeat protein